MTGEGLKIAVIDSGVNPLHPHICAPTRCVALSPEDTGEDTLGHGTAVTAAIQEKAPGAQYYAIKLFGSTLRATGKRLIEALEWTIAQGMDLVNLSLGTQNPDYRLEMEALVRRAGNAGVLLVSARRAGDQPVFPGALEGVIGVEVDWDLPRERYRVEVNGRPRFFASGFPRPLPGRPQTRNLHGVSFAVANMTGFAARVRAGLDDSSFDGVLQALIQAA